MRTKDTFSSCHPVNNFLWFGLVLAFSMCFRHPIYLAIALVSSLTYSIYLKRGRGIRFFLIWMLPLMIITALINPAFTHKGMTILCYLPSGNPLTLESIVYGIASAAMAAAAIMWFSCYNEIMTSDKFVFMFGRIIPALSLVISMTLAFVPKFSTQYRKVRAAQLMLHPENGKQGFTKRMKSGTSVLSAMITWSLENAIETGDSMRSRGYGLPKRTAYSIYRFELRDGIILAVLVCCGSYLFTGALIGAAGFRYYPFISGEKLTVFKASFIPVYVILCLLPLILDVREDLVFRKIRNRIA